MNEMIEFDLDEDVIITAPIKEIVELGDVVRVEVSDDFGKDVSLYRVVEHPEEIDIESDIITITKQSPLGKELVDKCVGDEIDFPVDDNKITGRILEIVPDLDLEV